MESGRCLCDCNTIARKMQLENVNMSTRDANINIRVARKQRDLIDQAAKLAHKTRASFILDAATVDTKARMVFGFSSL